MDVEWNGSRFCTNKVFRFFSILVGMVIIQLLSHDFLRLELSVLSVIASVDIIYHL